MDGDTAATQVLFDRNGDLAVHRRQDLIGAFHDVDPDTPVVQVLGHLQADVTGPDHDRPYRLAAPGLLLGQVLVDPGFDAVHIADATQRLDRRVVDTGQRWANRDGAGGQRQVLVVLGVLGAGIDLADRHGAGPGVDADDLGTDPHVDVERVAQALRSLQEQPIAVGDHLADVIGQTAVGEGDVVSALEDDDLGGLIEPAGAGRDRGAGGHPSHHNELHGYSPPCYRTCRPQRNART